MNWQLGKVYFKCTPEGHIRKSVNKTLPAYVYDLLIQLKRSRTHVECTLCYCDSVIWLILRQYISQIIYQWHFCGIHNSHKPILRFYRASWTATDIFCLSWVDTSCWKFKMACSVLSIFCRWMYTIFSRVVLIRQQRSQQNGVTKR